MPRTQKMCMLLILQPTEMPKGSVATIFEEKCDHCPPKVVDFYSHIPKDARATRGLYVPV